MIPAQRHPGQRHWQPRNFRVRQPGSTTRVARHWKLRAWAVDLGDDGVAFRLNLIYGEGDVLVDYSAGHIASAEAAELVEALAAELGGPSLRFYPGVGYRHLLVWDCGPEEVATYPPHDIMGESMAAHGPTGVGAEKIRALMAAAGPILAASPVNAARSRLAASGRPTQYGCGELGARCA